MLTYLYIGRFTFNHHAPKLVPPETVLDVTLAETALRIAAFAPLLLLAANFVWTGCTGFFSCLGAFGSKFFRTVSPSLRSLGITWGLQKGHCEEAVFSPKQFTTVTRFSVREKRQLAAGRSL